MNKQIITFDEYTGLVQDICRQITLSNWRPEYIVGITRGGLFPAVMISQYFGIPMQSLDVSLRDHTMTVSNCGMSEDAWANKPILIVDDINDTGATLNWIMNDWQDSCMPSDDRWNFVWGNNVKFAVVVDNLGSECKADMDFVGFEVNKLEKDVWIEFPYEDWWKK
jgi:hypoxanthine phosphoribosyltransferase